MITEEEIEKAKESWYWKGYIQKQKEAMEICKICKYREKVEQLETEKQNLIEKLEEKLERNNRDIELAETGKLNLSSEEWAEIETENKLIKEILSYMKGEEK